MLARSGAAVPEPEEWGVEADAVPSTAGMAGVAGMVESGGGGCDGMGCV